MVCSLDPRPSVRGQGRRADAVKVVSRWLAGRWLAGRAGSLGGGDGSGITRRIWTACLIYSLRVAVAVVDMDPVGWNEASCALSRRHDDLPGPDLPPPLPQTLVAPSHYLRVLSSQHSSSVAETYCLTTFIDEHGHEVNYSVALLAPADPQLVVPLRESRVPSVRDGLDILQEHHANKSIPSVQDDPGHLTDP